MNTMIVWNSELYDDKHRFVYQYGESLLEILNPAEGEQILDLGCGTGSLTDQIAQKKARVSGIDASEDMILKARKNYPDIDFQILSAENMRYENCFDAVFSNAVFHWLEDPEKAMGNIYTSLKAKGRLVAEFGGKDNVKAMIDTLKENLIRTGHQENALIDFWYFPSVAEYASLLEKTGFKISWIQYYDRPTELTDALTGVKDWFRMFGEYFFRNMTAEETEKVLELTQRQYAAMYTDKGKLFADYRRLRVVAVKP